MRKGPATHQAPRRAAHHGWAVHWRTSSAALGADPTVYRHFASKDDLVLAIADHLLEEAHAGMIVSDCWVEALEESCRHAGRRRAPARCGT